MTVKEIAEFTDKRETTVRNWLKKACDINGLMATKNGASTSTHPADYTVDEVELILNQSSIGQNAVMIVMANARKTPVNVQNAVDYEVIGKMIGMAVSTAMIPVVKQLENISRPALTAPTEDYYTLVAYCSINKIQTSISELRKIGMELRKMTISSGKELRQVPDERWAHVNSYPVEILDEYFTV